MRRLGRHRRSDHPAHRKRVHGNAQGVLSATCFIPRTRLVTQPHGARQGAVQRLVELAAMPPHCTDQILAVTPAGVDHAGHVQRDHQTQRPGQQRMGGDQPSLAPKPVGHIEGAGGCGASAAAASRPWIRAFIGKTPRAALRRHAVIGLHSSGGPVNMRQQRAWAVRLLPAMRLTVIGWPATYRVSLSTRTS